MASEAKTRTGPHAIVVDDEPMAAELAERAIRRLWPGADVEVCYGFHEALAALAASAAGGYDVAVIDNHMPDGSGLRLAERAREHGVRRVLVVSSSPRYSRREEAEVADKSDLEALLAVSWTAAGEA